jgi:hypothetical protein
MNSSVVILSQRTEEKSNRRTHAFAWVRRLLLSGLPGPERGLPFSENLLQDMRYALRLLVKSPGPALRRNGPTCYRRRF